MRRAVENQNKQAGVFFLHIQAKPFNDNGKKNEMTDVHFFPPKQKNVHSVFLSTKFS